MFLELFNKLDTTNIFVLLEVFEELDGFIDKLIGAKMALRNMCVLVKYLQNSYESIRYKKQPSIDNESLHDFIDQTDKWKSMLSKTNALLTEHFEMDKQYLL